MSESNIVVGKPSFFKFLIETFKESKWLLLRYFVVGILLIAISVIANKLNLQDLTYYNAMLTLCFFGEMIGFGFTEGCCMYVNHYLKNKSKAISYARLGFYASIILTFCTVILLACFPNFVLTYILNLDFQVDLTFYYIMLVCVVLLAVFNYMMHVLKKLGEYKLQLVATFVQSGLLTLSLLLIFLTEWFNLVSIGIVYLVVYIACIIVCNICLKKNKLLPMNLFGFEKYKFTSSEIKTILFRSCSEIVWEVGYLFISLFILKCNVIVYNQYSYLENALDIFNGIFFAFISVVSLKICRSIGEENKAEAKWQAEYLFYATFILWGIFAVLSLLVYIPLKEGINLELQPTMFICFILYLTIYLFRFLEWNLGTYILGQSSYFAKPGFILELIFMLYWIVLFFIGDLIPDNIFLIYSLIAIENIIKIIVSMVVYKKGKWLDK